MILETADGREKDVQDIDAPREYEKRVVTLLVMRIFSGFLGASRACAYFRDPTAVSRMMHRISEINLNTPEDAGLYLEAHRRTVPGRCLERLH